MRYTGLSSPLASRVKLAGAGVKSAEVAVGVDVLPAVAASGIVAVGGTAVGGILVAGTVAAGAVAGASEAPAVGTRLGTNDTAAVGIDAVAAGNGVLAGAHAEATISSQTNRRGRRLKSSIFRNWNMFPFRLNAARVWQGS